MEFTISKGFEPNERNRIAALYWEAFAHKLHYVMGPKPKALYFIAAQLDPEFAMVARNLEGRVLGIAGFKTAKGALIGGEMSDLAHAYGWISALWRGPILSLLERDLAKGILLMDGISVSSEARGGGLGTALLEAIKNEAAEQGLTSVRLDVIDTNPRAKALYERQGFKSIGVEKLGPLRFLFGFRRSTKMLCDVPAQE